VSEAHEPDAPQEQGAMGVEQRAADWLVRQKDLEGWTASDRGEFEDWLAQSLSHRIAYVRLRSVWSHADRLAALRPSRPASLGSLAGRPILARIVAAAGAMAIVGAAAMAVVSWHTGEQTYATAVGGHEIVTLADSSRIELNTDTVVRAQVDAGGQRTVWLDHGEALFQIRHDAAHPFVVMAGNRRITDLGTEFTVRRDGARLEVALLKGRAFIDRANGNDSSSSALLTPGDVAVATANSMSVTKASAHALADSLGWRRGVVVFDHTALSDAVAEFNRYNRHKLVIADPAVGRVTIGGTFDVRNVEAFADIAKHAIGLHVVERGGESVISR
jgi:transmembrane sensor